MNQNEKLNLIGRVLCLTTLPMVVVSCMHSEPRSAYSRADAVGKRDEAPVRKSTAVLEMEQRRKLKEEHDQDQKDQARLLAKKETIAAVESSKSSMISTNMRAPLHVPVQSIINPAQFGAMSEDALYQELAAKFNQNDDLGFQVRYEVFRKRFPRGAYAADAMYLYGKQQVALKNYGQALKTFSEIANKFPYSPKKVSALFGKAAVYKRMNLSLQAKQLFQKITNQYPGSPESFRAASELRNLK